MRKAITSSKISTAPQPSATSRAARMKGAVGMMRPMRLAMGSTMMAASRSLCSLTAARNVSGSL